LTEAGKRKITLAAAVAQVTAGAIALTIGSAPASAASQWWDINGASAGAGGATPSGVWDNLTANWTTDSTGASATHVYVNDGSSTPTFSAGTDATGAFAVTISGTQQINGFTDEEGALTLSGGGLTLTGGAITLAKQVTFNTPIGSTFSGPIVKAGAGTMVLGAANTFTNELDVTAGIVSVTNSSALGDTTGTTVITQGAGVQLNNNITTGESFTIAGNVLGPIRGVVQQAAALDAYSMPGGWLGAIDNGSGNNTITGNITLAGAGGNNGQSTLNTISVSSGTLTVAGLIQQDQTTTPRNVAKTGPGTLVLASTNTYDGLTRMWGGTIIVEADGALGTGQAGYNQNSTASPADFTHSTLFFANADATIAFQAPASSPQGFSYSTNEYIQTSSWGHGSLGEIDNLGGNNTFTGQIDLGFSPSTAQANSGNLNPNYIGVTSGSLTLNGKLGMGSTNTSTTERNLTKIGTGNLILDGQGVSAGPNSSIDFQGQIEVQQGTLTFANGAAIQNALPIIFWLDVGANGTLAIDNTNYVYGKASDGLYQPIKATSASSATKTTSTQGNWVSLFGGEYKLIGNQSIGYPVAMDFNDYTNYGVVRPYGTSTFTVVPQGGDTYINIQPRSTYRETYLIRGMDNLTGDSHGRILAAGATLVGGGGTPGTSTVSILPYAYGDASSSGTGTDFVTIDSGANTARVLASNEYITLADGNATLDNTIASVATTINNPTTVNSIKLTGGNVTVGSTNTMTLNAGALLATGGTASSINGGTIALGGTEGVFFTAAGSSLSLGSVITGTNGLTIGGNGSVTLTGVNTFTGAFTLDGGILNISNNNQLGATADIATLAGGTLQIVPTSLSSSRLITLAGRPTINLNSGQSLTLSGVISAAPGGDYTDIQHGITSELIKTGAGTLVLSGTNTFSGLNILGGVVSVNKAAAMGVFQSWNPTVIDGGTLTFTNTTSITLGNIGFLLGKGNGTINVSSAAGTVRWGTSSTAVSTSATLSGPGSLTKAGPGTMEIASTAPNYNGGTFVTGGTLQVDSPAAFPVGVENTFVSASSTGRLLVVGATAAPAITMQYDVNLANTATFGASGLLTYGPATGTGSNLITVVDGSTAPSVSLQTQAATDVFTINSPLTNSAGTTHTPTVNITGPGTVNLMAAPFAGFVSNFSVASGSTLGLQAATSITGSLTTAGTVNISNAVSTARLIQTAGSPLNFTGSGKLTIASGSTASILTAVPTFASGTALEINNNKVVIDYSATDGDTILLGNLRTALASGASFTGNTPTWTGTGIISSTAAADSNKITGIGYLESSSLLGTSGGTYGGVAVDGSALLLKYTYFGDVNLDGKITADDYALLDKGYAQYNTGAIPTGTAIWQNGDFNYDGVVDSNDYMLADTAFGKQSGVLDPSFLAAREAEFGSAYVSQLVAAVPEPTSLAIIGLIGAGLVGRRQRRS
jgi:autotransporter-associated beta strand protein